MSTPTIVVQPVTPTVIASAAGVQGPQGPAGSGGSSLARTTVKTANYTAAASDLVPVDTTSQAVTVTLANAPADKTQIAVALVTQGGSNAATVACAGTDVFTKTGGPTTLALALGQLAWFEYTATGGIWTQLAGPMAPTGTASGDLAGSYPAPTLAATANVEAIIRANRLDQLATPTAPIALGSQKITSLANGTLATDAAAFGQIPTTLPPNGSASGDLSGSYPSPTVTATHLAAPLPLAQGGTGSATQNFVDLTTGQSVGGTKTFTGEIIVPTPVNAGDAATKAYADSIAAGLSVKPSVAAATTGPLPTNTYNNGQNGLGATLTGNTTGALTVDGHTVAAGDRILVKDETALPENGIYVCTTAGAVGVAYVLTRATDNDTQQQFAGAFVFVEQGTVNTGAGFVVTGNGPPFNVGTTGVVWSQFSGAGEITAGTGLTKTGNTIALSTPVAVNLGGTGQSTQQAALNALAGAVTAGRVLRGDGTNVTLAAIQPSDVPTLNQNTSGTAAGLSSTLAIGSGGTGQTTAAAAYNALSPMTTLGDLEYESGANTAARLPGNTSATKQFLTQTGTGSASASPAWGAIQAADIPTLNQNTTGTAAGLSATLALASGGTGATSAIAARGNLGEYAFDTPASRGMLEYNYPPLLATISNNLVSGSIYGITFTAQSAGTTAKVGVGVLSSAATPTAGQNLIGLYSVSGTTATQIAVTGDLGTWSSQGFQSYAWGVSQALTQGGIYILLLMSNASTPVHLAGLSTTAGFPAMYNAGLSNTASPFLRAFLYGTAQTALPASFTISGTTMSNTNAQTPWACLL